MGEETTYAYDDAGNLIRKIDAKNQKTEYVYDDVGRLTDIKYYAVGKQKGQFFILQGNRRVSSSFFTGKQKGQFFILQKQKGQFFILHIRERETEGSVLHSSHTRE